MRKLRNRQPTRALALGAMLLVPALVTVQGCTDLDESPFSAITPDNFYQTEEEVLGGLAAVYSGLKSSLWGYYNLSQVTTDETIVPTRGGDWFDGGRWLELHRQTWSTVTASAEDITGTWNDAMVSIARANVLLSVMPNVSIANRAAVEAEVRTLRAFYYYMLMDMFGGVPIVEDLEIRPRERASRADVFRFIESELLAARGDLPQSWPANMHGRMTQGAADAILASMYINAGVFTKDDGVNVTSYNSCSGVQVTGGDACAAAIAAADRILNSGAYSMAADWHANFRHDNHLSPENILVVKSTNRPGFGWDNHFLYRALHYNSGAGGGWNGFSTLAEVYYAYDTLRIETQPVPGTNRTADILISRDKRHSVFLAGLHKHIFTGEQVFDRNNVPLFFTPEIRDATSATEGEGVRIYKWPGDPDYQGQWHRNDVAYYRLAEMHLIKAEALNEQGNQAGAVASLNIVRARAFDPPRPYTGPMDQASVRRAIQRERLMELTGEAKRRQDLIRYGEYTKPWAFKDQREPHRVLMPIPQSQIDANPLLVQNAGY